MTTRINLLSSPRNLSTALMYSFANRSDTQVYDEPLYAHFLKQSKKQHPGREETLASMSANASEVINNTLLGPCKKPIVFFKQMSHHLPGLDWSFLKAGKNIIYIRNPEEIIFSYSKVIPKVRMDDIGIDLQVQLLDYLQSSNAHYVVLDSTTMLKSPKKILEQLCLSLEIPFESSMLKWESGPRKEDGVWAKYWYKNLHKSTGFQAYKKKDIQLSDENQKLAEACQPIFQRLMKEALKP